MNAVERVQLSKHNEKLAIDKTSKEKQFKNTQNLKICKINVIYIKASMIQTLVN